MSRLTTEYGELISLYEGVGNLNDILCSFEVGQKPDGTIIFSCSSKEIFDPDTRSIVLSGFIDDGTPIRAEGKVSPRCSLVVNNDDTNSQCYFRSYTGLRLTLGTMKMKNANEVRFSIANFIFGGDGGTQLGEWKHQKELALELGGFDISFEKSSNYRINVDSLIKKDVVGITCDLVIKVESQTVQQTIEFANDICILLSIAAGRSIDWVNMRLLDSNSLIFSSHAQHRRISAVSGLDMIDFGDSQDAAAYLTQCYPTFKKINPEYEIDRVASVLGDLRPHPFLETRALLMYSIVDSFTQKVSDNESLEARLKHLLNTFQVSYKNKEANHFATSRNSISHEFEFETPNNRGEYFRNLDLYHRLLLRMLNYDSYYNDVSKFANNTGPLRQKLKVAEKPPGN